VRLSPEERKAALVLNKALDYAEELIQTGEKNAHQLRAWIAQTIDVEPLATLDYVVVVDPDELKDVDTIENGAVALVAATFGKVRLIDNRLLKRE
jgi:pantoate--beta-alanine ligase